MPFAETSVTIMYSPLENALFSFTVPLIEYVLFSETSILFLPYASSRKMPFNAPAYKNISAKIINASGLKFLKTAVAIIMGTAAAGMNAVSQIRSVL